MYVSMAMTSLTKEAAFQIDPISPHGLLSAYEAGVQYLGHQITYYSPLGTATWTARTSALELYI